VTSAQPALAMHAATAAVKARSQHMLVMVWLLCGCHLGDSAQPVWAMHAARAAVRARCNTRCLERLATTKLRQHKPCYKHFEHCSAAYLQSWQNKSGMRFSIKQPQRLTLQCSDAPAPFVAAPGIATSAMTSPPSLPLLCSAPLCVSAPWPALLRLAEPRLRAENSYLRRSTMVRNADTPRAISWMYHTPATCKLQNTGAHAATTAVSEQGRYMIVGNADTPRAISWMYHTPATCKVQNTEGLQQPEQSVNR
jgi:hypothetical protein